MVVAFADIQDAIAILHRGDRPAAKVRLLALWSQLPSEASFERAVVAHYLADAQEQLDDELAWDLRALEAATGAADPDAARVLGGTRVTLASFMPSLHLNLASDYERARDLASARHHLDAAAGHIAALDDSPISALTRAAIERMRARLAERA